MEEEDFYVGIRSKLMGQADPARIGSRHTQARRLLHPTTGILADHPASSMSSARHWSMERP